MSSGPHSWLTMASGNSRVFTIDPSMNDGSFSGDETNVYMVVTSTLIDDFFYDPNDPTFVGTSSIAYDVKIFSPCVGATIVEPITWYDSNVIRVPNGGTSAGLFSFTMSNPLCTSGFNGSP